MSVVGVSSYFLWTQKGMTNLPLVRGSGFLVAFKQHNTFYHHHVLTAAHVSCPVRFKPLYGDTIGLRAIGERHVTTRLLVPDVAAPRVKYSIPLVFKQEVLPNVDVATLRCTDERQLAGAGLTPLEMDMDPIEEGTELVFCGCNATEERANPNDDGLTLTQRRLEGVCKAALVSLDYGTVLLASIERDVSSASGEATVVSGDLVSPLPLGMCGGPVLRKSSGKCVGVIAARVLKNAPPRDPNAGALYQDPYLDVSENKSLHSQWPIDVAFVPIGEFYHAMRRSEM